MFNKCLELIFKFKEVVIFSLTGLISLLLILIQPSILKIKTYDVFFALIPLIVSACLLVFFNFLENFNLTEKVTLGRFLSIKNNFTKETIDLIIKIKNHNLNALNLTNQEIVDKCKQIFINEQDIEQANRLMNLDILIELDLWECDNVYKVSEFGIELINRLTI